MNDTVFLIIAGVFGAIIVFAIVYFITSSSRKKKLGVMGMVTNNKGLTQGKSLIRQDFTHYYTRIIGVTRQNGEVIANVLLGLEFKEYFLDSANQVIGNNQFPISKEINLLLAVKNNTRAVMSCTHCGALVTSRVTPKCGYCEKPIVSYDYEFTILKERSRTIRKPKFFNN